jgi:hypothetical protein
MIVHDRAPTRKSTIVHFESRKLVAKGEASRRRIVAAAADQASVRGLSASA